MNGDAPRSRGPAPAPRSVEVCIEELVLHGVAPGGRHRIAAALEAELARLLTERGVPTALTRGAALARLEADAFRVRPGARPASIGAQVARAIYDGLSG